MAGALLRDLTQLPGMNALATRDPRAEPLPPAIEVFTPASAEDALRLVADCIERSDATWIIAPESGGVLERLSAEVLARGRCLLGSRPAAVRIAASKARTAATLNGCGVPVVPTWDPGGPIPSGAGPVVLKPDDGVGCLGTRLYPDVADAIAAWVRAGRDPNAVLQPFVEGDAASLSLLVAEGRAVVLGVNRQIVVCHDGCFRFQGCAVNGLASWQIPLAGLAQRVAEALPGLWGYVGVDFILTDEGAVVLEVNPRLTTSYVGLRESIGENPAAWVLGLLDQAAPLPAAPPALRSVEVRVEPERAVA